MHACIRACMHVRVCDMVYLNFSNTPNTASLNRLSYKPSVLTQCVLERLNDLVGMCMRWVALHSGCNPGNVLQVVKELQILLWLA